MEMPANLDKISALIDYHPKVVTLSDGTRILIRAVQPDDAARIAAMHHCLSDHSIYMRYMGWVERLDEYHAQELCDIDYLTEMRLVAVPFGDHAEHIVAMASYVALGEEEIGGAEFAILIEDAYQGRGLGTCLFKELISYARSHGIQTFLIITNGQNDRMLRLVRHCGLPFSSEAEYGVWGLQLRLNPEEA